MNPEHLVASMREMANAVGVIAQQVDLARAVSAARLARAIEDAELNIVTLEFGSRDDALRFFLLAAALVTPDPPAPSPDPFAEQFRVRETFPHQ